MNDVIYIFIDAGYLKRAYQDTVRRIFGDHFEINYFQIKNGFNARRAFYYDCIDDIKKVGESDADFQTRVQKQEEYLDSIDALEGFHVRRGHLARGRMNQQKEVDVLLAVDMMNHAFSRNMTKAVLISGDRDFRPVVQSVAGTGTYVEVMYRRETGSKDLGRAADMVSYLDLVTLVSWTAVGPGESVFAYMPSTSRQQFSSQRDLDAFKEPNWQALRNGIAGPAENTRNIRSYKSNDELYYKIDVDAGNLILARHAFNDLAKLEEFIACQYGPITWT